MKWNCEIVKNKIKNGERIIIIIIITIIIVYTRERQFSLLIY
jgi:hypothetical protein